MSLHDPNISILGPALTTWVFPIAMIVLANTSSSSSRMISIALSAALFLTTAPFDTKTKAVALLLADRSRCRSRYARYGAVLVVVGLANSKHDTYNEARWRLPILAEVLSLQTN
jgi:hypothetical protein